MALGEKRGGGKKKEKKNFRLKSAKIVTLITRDLKWVGAPHCKKSP